MLIGLCGKKGSGKTTLAQLIGGERLSFADPIRAALVAMGVEETSFLPENKELPLLFFQGKTLRYAMQTLGTEWGRETISSTFWESILVKRVVESKSDIIVVDDVRFASEVDTLRFLQAKLVYIERPDIGTVDKHISETLNPVNLSIPVIKNTGTPEQLLEAFNALPG